MKFSKKNILFKMMFVMLAFITYINFEPVYALDDSDFSSYCKYKLNSNATSLCDSDKAYIYIGLKNGSDDTVIQGSSACFRVGDEGEFYKDGQSKVVLGGDKKNYCPTTVNYCPASVGGVSVVGHLQFRDDCNGALKFTLVDVKGNTFKKYEPVFNDLGYIESCKTGESKLSTINNKIDQLDKSINSNNISSDTIKRLSREKETISNDIVNAINANYCEQDEVKKVQKKYETFNKKFIDIVEKGSLSSTEKEKLKSDANAEKKMIDDTALTIKKYSFSNQNDVDIPTGDLKECDDLIDDDLKNVIDIVLNVVRVAAPIFLIVLTAVDFGQIVISNDKDAMPKAISKAIKRGIAALVIFFIPFLVDLIIKWLNDYSSIKDAANCIK